MNEHVLYAISRGLRYEDGQIIGLRGRPLKPYINGHGYKFVDLPKSSGGHTSVSHHKLVYYFETGDERAFAPEYSIHHIDGDRVNNSILNLRLMTLSDHMRLENTGEKNSNAKITKAQADEIKIKRQAGYRPTELAQEYNITMTNVWYITSGKSWK